MFPWLSGRLKYSGHFAPNTPGHFGSYSHTFPHFQHLDRIHGTIVLSTYMNGWIFTGFQVGDYTNPMDPVMGTPWHLPICTSQSLSPASQPKSSGNSSTKMVRVRPLVWRLCFFSGKNNQRQEKKMFPRFSVLCLVCFPKFRFVVFLLISSSSIWWFAEKLLGKRQIESSNADKSHEKTVEKNQFQHIQASGGFKKQYGRPPECSFQS